MLRRLLRKRQAQAFNVRHPHQHPEAFQAHTQAHLVAGRRSSITRQEEATVE